MNSEESSGEKSNQPIIIIPHSAIMTAEGETLYSVLVRHLHTLFELSGYVSAESSKELMCDISGFLSVELGMDGTLKCTMELNSQRLREYASSFALVQTSDANSSTSNEF